jgi:hypothetical protein
VSDDDWGPLTNGRRALFEQQLAKAIAVRDKAISDIATWTEALEALKAEGGTRKGNG